MDGFNMGTLIGVAVIVLAVVLLVMFLVSRYQTPKVNQAIVISGSTAKGDGAMKVLTKRGGFVWPIIQRSVSISLIARQITTECDVISNDKITLHVSAVATFKVGETDESIAAAAQRFAEHEEDIKVQVNETLEGSLRAIVGTLNVEDLLTDRQKFQEKVREEINETLGPQGLQLDNLNIKEIDDGKGYIEALGRPQQAQVKRDAEIKEAQATQASEEARIASRKKINDAQKELQIQEAEIKEATSRRQAEADAAEPIAKAEQAKKIAEAQQQVELANVAVTKAKLQSEVNAQADADKYRRVVDAQADAEAQIETTKGSAAARQEQARGEAEAKKLDASGVAEATRLNAAAEAEAIKAKAEANADAIRLEGQARADAAAAQGKAEAEAIKAKGLAEAEAMQKKADAYKKYGDAAILDSVLKVLPELAASSAKPLENSTITVVGSDATDKVSNIVTDVAAKAPALIKGLTGIDVADTVRGLTETHDGSKDDTAVSESTVIDGNVSDDNETNYVDPFAGLDR